MPFKQKYFSNDFYEVIPENNIVTTTWITKQIGCVTETAMIYLTQLEEQGKIRKVKVLGGNEVNWQRVV